MAYQPFASIGPATLPESPAVRLERLLEPGVAAPRFSFGTPMT